MDATKRVEQSDLENTYKFVPTEEPWTWEQRYPVGQAAGGIGLQSQWECLREPFNRWNNDAAGDNSDANRVNLPLDTGTVCGKSLASDNNGGKLP